ncbi:MAG: domain protein transpeptidase [Actinomycetia bacterium]|nr:domain protein transpeptidase [Actinomycetes bacterium]
MTSLSNEWGGHAGPLGSQGKASSLGTTDFGATEFDAIDATDMSVPVPPAPVRPEPPIFAGTASAPPVGLVPVSPVLAGPATSPPASTGTVPASPPSKGGDSGGKGHRKQPGGRPGRVKRYGRMVAVLAVLAAVLGVGFNTDFGSEASAEPVVQSFLQDWQQGHYTAAAELTSGQTSLVSSQLAGAGRNLNATGMFFSLSSVSQHGNTAEAEFNATVDLADGQLQWKYQGHFGLVSKDGRWIVNWTPSAIEPSLGTGDRLAVVTTFSPRGQVTDSAGQSLIDESPVFHVGVYPGQLSDTRVTAADLARVTGLNSTQVLGQISSAPPHRFLSMLTLDPNSFARLWPSLSHIRGLTWQSAQERLFNSDTDDAVGEVGAENSLRLRDEGAGYQPGATVGLSGLEATDQDSLAGSPSVAVIVVNSRGQKVASLQSWRGVPGKPLKTTINGQLQATATRSLASLPASAGIVAVDAATGHIVALAGHEVKDAPLPSGGLVDSRIQPGIAFTVVSAAALLSNGLTATSPLPCQNVANVGGQTFTYSPGQSSSATLASDFASGCGTAFATVSLRLTQASLAAAEKAFGVEAPWGLRVPAFSGSVSAASTSEAGLASQAIGGGGVLMSPLGMALIAADVDSGVGHTPALLPGDRSTAWPVPLSASELTSLRGLMRDAVQSGPARVANVPGVPVYGQAGVVQTGANDYLSWFVGYRGEMAFAVVEEGHTQAQAAAALAATFLRSMG